MTASNHDPEQYEISMLDIDRRLGFRVGKSGIERLAWVDDDPGTPGVPRAVQPVLNGTDALNMYAQMRELVHLLDLSRRDVKFWKDKAFAEADARTNMKAVDARSVKDSLDTPKRD